MTGGSLSGLLLVDKPIGSTSHDVVRWVRCGLRERRVGHAGTLDPLASGLLPCLVGPATRLASHLHFWSKTYVGVIQLGQETDTGDLEGAEELAAAPLPPSHMIAAGRTRFLGIQQQVPPAYSAKKVGGVRAHTLARQGFAPVLAPVSVTVHALRLSASGDGRLSFAARVSSGTYIRALARDLGRYFGTGAHLIALRRLGIGPIRVREALSQSEALEGETLRAHLIPPEQIPLPYPTVRLTEGEEQRFRRGQPVGGALAPTGIHRAINTKGRLIGLGAVADDLLRPTVVFPPG